MQAGLLIRGDHRSRCARFEEPPREFASRLPSCYLYQPECDAECVYKSRRGRLAQTPRRLQTLAGSLPRTINGVLRTMSFPLLPEVFSSHLPQQAVCARMRALAGAALPVGRLTASSCSWKSCMRLYYTSVLRDDFLNELNKLAVFAKVFPSAPPLGSVSRRIHAWLRPFAAFPR